jgi:hypothetical protein
MREIGRGGWEFNFQKDGGYGFLCPSKKASILVVPVEDG